MNGKKVKSRAGIEGRIKTSGGFSFKWKSKLDDNGKVRKGRAGCGDRGDLAFYFKEQFPVGLWPRD